MIPWQNQSVCGGDNEGIPTDESRRRMATPFPESLTFLTARHGTKATNFCILDGQTDRKEEKRLSLFVMNSFHIPG